jgi:hypothetical protein
MHEVVAVKPEEKRLHGVPRLKNGIILKWMEVHGILTNSIEQSPS